VFLEAFEDSGRPEKRLSKSNSQTQREIHFERFKQGQMCENKQLIVESRLD